MMSMKGNFSKSSVEVALASRFEQQTGNLLKAQALGYVAIPRAASLIVASSSSRIHLIEAISVCLYAIAHFEVLGLTQGVQIQGLGKRISVIS